MAILVLICGVAVFAAPALADTPFSWSSPVAIDTPNSVSAVSCPSMSLCVAVDDSGNVVTTTDPTGGHGRQRSLSTPAWSAKQVAATNDVLYGVSCSSPSFCVVTDGNGYAITGTANAQPTKCVVPKVIGKPLGVAKHAITTHACSVGRVKHAKSRTTKKNRVISQKPKPGSRLSQGAKVNLVVSKGP